MVGSSDSSLTAAKESSGVAAPEAGAEGDSAVRATDAVQSLAAQIDHFTVAVLARAEAVSGVFQRFAVVKVLKGDGPAEVRLRVADRPADVGRLHLLLLRPLAEASPEPTLSPIPSVAASAQALATVNAGEPVAYSYRGEMAVLRELPAGTDPATVELP